MLVVTVAFFEEIAQLDSNNYNQFEQQDAQDYPQEAEFLCPYPETVPENISSKKKDKVCHDICLTCHGFCKQNDVKVNCIKCNKGFTGSDCNKLTTKSSAMYLNLTELLFDAVQYFSFMHASQDPIQNVRVTLNVSVTKLVSKSHYSVFKNADVFDNVTVIGAIKLDGLTTISGLSFYSNNFSVRNSVFKLSCETVTRQITSFVATVANGTGEIINSSAQFSVANTFRSAAFGLNSTIQLTNCTSSAFSENSSMVGGLLYSAKKHSVVKNCSAVVNGSYSRLGGLMYLVNAQLKVVSSNATISIEAEVAGGCFYGIFGPLAAADLKVELKMVNADQAGGCFAYAYDVVHISRITVEIGQVRANDFGALALEISYATNVSISKAVVTGKEAKCVAHFEEAYRKVLDINAKGCKW